MDKRESCRAIIIDNNKLVVMYREKNDRVYYTFPGGGMEENETKNQCVIREVKEEFGLDIEPIKEIYTYTDEKTIQHYFVSKWIAGELGSGEGEEFQGDTSRGVYIPMLVDTNRLAQLPLMPPEITHQLIEDLAKYGDSLDNKDCSNILGEL